MYSGVDVIVMNNVMFTLKKGGIMTTIENQYYTWSSRDIKPYSNVAGA